MADNRLLKGKQSYGILLEKLVRLGFKDKRTKLILYDCYVRSVLMFGCNVWGVNLISQTLPIV